MISVRITSSPIGGKREIEADDDVNGRSLFAQGNVNAGLIIAF